MASMDKLTADTEEETNKVRTTHAHAHARAPRPAPFRADLTSILRTFAVYVLSGRPRRRRTRSRTGGLRLRLISWSPASWATTSSTRRMTAS